VEADEALTADEALLLARELRAAARDGHEFVKNRDHGSAVAVSGWSPSAPARAGRSGPPSQALAAIVVYQY
jgi:hypothetical protein